MKLQSIFTALLFLVLSVQITAQPMASNSAHIEEAKAPGDIVAVAAANEDFSTLVAAVKAADLVATLQSEGPFTVFAPTNEAFNKLPDGTVAGLLEPNSKAQLQNILTYHVVAGKLKAKDVVAAIKAGKGSAKVETVSGGTLTAMMKGGKVWLKDENGGMSEVISTDVKASNGVIHVIDSVVLPK